MAIKVSVVMATYNSASRLREVVESVQRQSMAQEEFELVMVDDGSSDQTPALARELAEIYPNVRAERIEHSGWPSRPRNVGIQLARGEYVFLMDDDDDVFPEALERMHAFAVRNRSDVLLGKEVVKGPRNPAWRTWRANVDRVPALQGDVLGLMTPHKLYRRAFLLEQDVRFPEDLTRLEDYSFNAQAFVRADVISILSDYPCYRWNADSQGIHTHPEQWWYWEAFLHSLEPIERELAPGPDQDAMLVRWYASRILGRVGPRLVSYSDDARAELLADVERLLPHFPERLDALLTPAQRMCSKLLRRGDHARLLRLSTVDAGVTLALEPGEMSWQGGQLVVSGTGTLHDGTGSPSLVRRVGDRLFRVLPPELASGFAQDELDITESVQRAGLEVWVRDRGTLVEWGVPTTGGLKVVDGPGSGTLQLGFTARIDPSTAAFGAALADGLWEIAVRVDAAGLDRRRLVRADGPDAAALVDGRPAVAFTGSRGVLLLDLAGGRCTLVDSVKPRPEDLTVTSSTAAGGEALDLVLRLPRADVRGSADLAGVVLVGGARYPARLVDDEQGARIIARLPADRLPPAGEHELRTRFCGRTSGRELMLAVGPGPTFRAARRSAAKQGPSARPVQVPASAGLSPAVGQAGAD